MYVRRVVGNSMNPTLKHGDIIIVKKIHHLHIKSNDLVVAIVDEKEVVKRVGLLKNGKIFLIGDNRSASTDSRTFGLISCTKVIGKVVFWFPNVVQRTKNRLKS